MSAPYTPSTHVISDNLHNRYLALWNLPVEFTWDDIVKWVLRILDNLENPVLERILHTNEVGTHVFWFKFRTIQGALAFRGTVCERLIRRGGPVLHCPFVLPADYAGANGRSTDFWDGRLKALSHDRPLTDAASLPNPYCKLSKTSPGLLDRLRMNPHYGLDYRKLSKSSRRRINRQKRAERATSDGGSNYSNLTGIFSFHLVLEDHL